MGLQRSSYEGRVTVFLTFSSSFTSFHYFCTSLSTLHWCFMRLSHPLYHSHFACTKWGTGNLYQHMQRIVGTQLVQKHGSELAHTKKKNKKQKQAKQNNNNKKKAKTSSGCTKICIYMGQLAPMIYHTHTHTYIYNKEEKRLNKLFFRNAQIFGPAAFLREENWLINY